MEEVKAEAMPVALLDGDELNDVVLRRVAVGSTAVVAFSTDGNNTELARRWASLGTGVPFDDGGGVADVRDAIIACASRKVLVLVTPPPANPRRFVARDLQGAASATEFDVPGIAVHIARGVDRSGSIAWLTDTGQMSGYGCCSPSPSGGSTTAPL